MVIAALRACDMCVIDHGSESLGNLLGACENCSLPVKEWTEMVYAVPFWQLVAYEAYNHFLPVFVYLEYASQSLFHGDAFASVLLAEFEENAVGHFVVERMVNL